MWADLASRSGLGRAGDLDGAAGTLDESHGLSEMGLDEALVFALPDPDARDALWTASGGWVGASRPPSPPPRRPPRTRSRMPGNRTFRPRREDANARNAASPGAPRRTTSNDRERAPAPPTPPLALRARASGGRTLSPETRVRVWRPGGGGGGPSERNLSGVAVPTVTPAFAAWASRRTETSLDRPKSPPGRHSETRGRDDRTRAMTEQKEEPKKNVAVDLECDDEFEEFGNEGAR